MPSQESRNSWINIPELKERLGDFFDSNRKELQLFGSTVNQTFEAFVFASVISWYKENGWDVNLIHPRRRNPNEETQEAKTYLRLKFSTRGRPDNYTYAKCRKDDEVIQIRHQLRVATRKHSTKNRYRANMVLDVAIIVDINLSSMGTDNYIFNDHLISFGEAKHMSAFAELIASFIGVAHEMQPERLKRCRFKNTSSNDRRIYPDHIAPFLFVSGFLFHTANGIVETIKRRCYDIDIYNKADQLSSSIYI